MELRWIFKLPGKVSKRKEYFEKTIFRYRLLILNQEVFKVSHLILSFSILGLISLVCIWIWQEKSTLNYVTDLFNLEHILTNLGISDAWVF